MAIELRCNGTLHGIVSDDLKTIEVKCKRRSCGARPGIVILHTIDLATGQTIQTDLYSEPRSRKAT